MPPITNFLSFRAVSKSLICLCHLIKWYKVMKQNKTTPTEEVQVVAGEPIKSTLPYRRPRSTFLIPECNVGHCQNLKPSHLACHRQEPKCIVSSHHGQVDLNKVLEKFVLATGSPQEHQAKSHSGCFRYSTKFSLSFLNGFLKQTTSPLSETPLWQGSYPDTLDSSSWPHSLI